ncbi:hypothetical protein [Phytohabitans rumicis]|uniref:Uncharacterized protein n=1 Tax=Phytohabitans rumicis TaxID=1076125 RepID=A0A6V8LD08_9ACTN|nr:hypothetical protein [Phytohabitans rumicis]GFJ92479.1 hypothetical protein Prum_061210 [Phytohabitans rumicis]
MVRKGMFYGAALIGIYLAVSHATQGGRLLTAGGGAVSTVVKTFQGR